MQGLAWWQLPLSLKVKAMMWSVSEWPCSLDWCPLSTLEQPVEVMPFPDDSVRAESTSGVMWHGACLIPRQGVIKADGRPTYFHTAFGPWCWLDPVLHLWFITADWLGVSLREPKERQRGENGRVERIVGVRLNINTKVWHLLSILFFHQSVTLMVWGEWMERLISWAKWIYRLRNEDLKNRFWHAGHTSRAYKATC